MAWSITAWWKRTYEGLREALTVRDTIVVLAEGPALGWTALGSYLLTFRDRVCHLMNLFLPTMFKLRQGPIQFLGLFLATKQEEFFLKRPKLWTILVPFFRRGTLPGNDFLPFARLPCSTSWVRKNAFCGWVQMKQVLAVRVGAKKAVGHIVWVVAY